MTVKDTVAVSVPERFLLRYNLEIKGAVSEAREAALEVVFTSRN